MQTIVGVIFKEGGKSYYFDPRGMMFKIGEGAVVDTANGLGYGTISIANKQVEDDEIKGTLKQVVRKATKRDTEMHNANLAKRKRALEEARKLIEKHKLEMKLVDAEYLFDTNKVIITFTSENRVDFRELVKDINSTLKTRAELKQIGIRDECKQKGGLGPCGRACCCNSYMNDFERVSIKMAKTQGLSLNPTKISGLCGRLMCCLAFENEYYKDVNKFMPKLGSVMASPAGNGVVEAIDMLKQTVRLRVQLESGDIERNTFTLRELGVQVPGGEECSCEGCNGGCKCEEKTTEVVETAPAVVAENNNGKKPQHNGKPKGNGQHNGKNSKPNGDKQGQKPNGKPNGDKQGKPQQKGNDAKDNQPKEVTQNKPQGEVSENKQGGDKKRRRRPRNRKPKTEGSAPAPTEN